MLALSSVALLAAHQPSTLPTSTSITGPETIAEEEEPRFAAPTRFDRIGRIIAPVMINGRGPFRLIVDTGASHSSISEEVAKLLGLSERKTSVAWLNGVTGSALVTAYQIERLQAGDLVIENRTVPVIDSSVLAGADGMLGMAGLRTKRLSVDFTRDRVIIGRDDPLGRHRFATIPVRRMPGGLLAVPATVHNVRAHAVIDTGAAHSLGNLALCEALDRKRRKQEKIRETQVYGATADISFGRIQSVSRIQLGKQVAIRGAHLVCGDFHIFKVWELEDEPAMVLGMDILGTVDALVIDFARPEVLVRS